MRVLNILAQRVAVPVVDGPAPNWVSDASAAGPINGLRMACGAYVALWDGNLQGTGKEAASGTYLVQFFVDGKLAGTIRVFNAK